MKITIDIPDENLDIILGDAAIAYWAHSPDDEDEYDTTDLVINQSCGDVDGKTRFAFPKKAQLREGLNIMAAKYPKVFVQCLSLDYDGSTGDILIQLALFGRLVFG